MKKTLLFAAAALAAVSANAETFTYDFFNNPPFIAEIASDAGNYDFVDKYGAAVNTSGEPFIVTEEGAEKGHAVLNRCISFMDGMTYTFTPDETAEATYGDMVITEEALAYPFLSWGEKGITRTLLMRGWGSLDEWKDDNYNGATADDWVSTKNGIAFNRLGTQGMVSRNDTYIQFPAVTGNVTVHVWAGTASDSSSKEQPINVLVTPVIDGVPAPDQAVNLVKEYGSFPEKRMVKMDPINMDCTGKNVAFRIGCDGNILHIYHVVIEGDKGVNMIPSQEAGIENIIVDEAVNADAPVYNILGQRVSDSYKGLVIKNGKKYIQK